MAFLVRRWHYYGEGMTLYRFEDHGDRYMIDGEIIASSTSTMDAGKVRTNRRMLARDILSGRADLLGAAQ